MDYHYIEQDPTVKRTPLANTVANRIVDLIQQEAYEPGSRIPSEFELANAFGVGRGTVREAVKILVSRNVLEIRPAKGTFVRDNPGVADDPLGLKMIPDRVKMIEDLLELRLLLECYAIRKAAVNATEEQIARMKELLKLLEQNEDNDELSTKYDIELHKTIAESSGNSVISTVLPVIQTNMEHFNSLSFVREWDVVNEGHRAMVSAVEQRNPALAEAETVKHLSYMTEKLKSIKSPQKQG